MRLARLLWSSIRIDSRSGTSIPNSPLLDAIPVLVDANMNLSLCCIPRKKYVIDIVESIDVDSSPGPDAFFFMNTIWQRQGKHALNRGIREEEVVPAPSRIPAFLLWEQVHFLSFFSLPDS